MRGPFLIEVNPSINKIDLNEVDGVEKVDWNILIKSKEISHILLLKMKKHQILYKAVFLCYNVRIS